MPSGCPELVAASTEEFEALAIQLAREPSRICRAPAKKLTDNRLTQPLFDTARTTRHIEAAYVTMWENSQRRCGAAKFSCDAMKLLFVCFSDFAMTVATPEHEALGGSESRMAYLSRQLAANGHDVTFAARLPPGTPARLMDVRHIPLAGLADDGYDAAVTLGPRRGPLGHGSSWSRAPSRFHGCI